MSDAELAAVAWKERCANCHGRAGRGDGPQGPMLGAKDLTSDEWLGKTSDADIAAVIRDGKNRMPAFPNLPKRVVDGLVKRIRAKGADPK
jgi:mono/diheme cytochrome c family protein